MRLPLVIVTEHELRVHSQRFPELETKAWQALLEWCQFHGIDPIRVPMCSSIVRNVEHCRVEYDEIQLGEDGKPVPVPGCDRYVVRRVVAQGEAPPLPWPAELLQVVGL
jgi:hypothetical protein